MADYNLELSRKHVFKHYPSRLQAIFLLDTEKEAQEYSKNTQNMLKIEFLNALKQMEIMFIQNTIQVGLIS